MTRGCMRDGDTTVQRTALTTHRIGPELGKAIAPAVIFHATRVAVLLLDGQRPSAAGGAGGECVVTLATLWRRLGTGGNSAMSCRCRK